jgi:hypothetical protein
MVGHETLVSGVMTPPRPGGFTTRAGRVLPLRYR